MKVYTIEKNFSVIGLPVKTFPNGIDVAFMDLMKKLPDGDNRTYYGIGECTDAGIVYIAAVEERKEGEGKKYGLENYVIEKGDYLAIEILDWKSKTSSIKNVFEEMFKDERADRLKPTIEIYQDERKMLCLVALNDSKDSFKGRNEKAGAYS